ncbi:phosphotransferase [Pseudomonas sp. MMS21-TM103]|uniref:phosphotransferase n=1 Tax=Pseudomonas sp. MMS21 TM103 TaxID=2886506 RepID=UPI001EDE1BEC|nr:phosphotransferase [Pseudomonas sp. MMS21 TM103]MCG4455922.1 phosphotransferase [Pseudomonas sp. MMS21 TM103]
MNAQQEVIAFLACPQSYEAPGNVVELIETHGSLIFLHGQRAYKLKRAIAYAALDFLSLDSRERACQAELHLNRRTAPDLYLEVRSINRAADGSLSFNGGGQVLDWVVVMRRFAQDALFERMALDGRLTLELMDRLGAEIARFHASAELTPAFGGEAGIRQAIEDNHQQLSLYQAQLDTVAVDALHHASRAALAQLAGLLEQRRREGRVRRCHGDLRLANICLYEGRPTLFDGIEFSEQIACIDVLYDLAFVLMDLRLHGLAGHADRLLHSYLEHSTLAEDCRPLPLFLSLRAATRCFTLAGSALRRSEPQARAEKTAQAQALLKQAQVYLRGDGQPLTLR